MENWTRRAVLSLAGGLLTLSPRAMAADAFTAYPGVKTLMTARQTAICHVADLDGTQTLLLLINGVPVEAHARHNGLYQPKDRAHSSSAKAISPVDFNRLIALAGALDKGLNGTPRGTDFLYLYTRLPVSAATPDPCPADLAQRPMAERARIRQGLRLPEYRRYTPCFSLDAQAVRLDFDDDPFFNAWTFQRDVQGNFYGLTLPGLRAIWSMEA